MPNLRELGVSFEHWCFACGRQNPSGLHLDYDVSRDRATARYTGTQKHQGYDGALHGGVVTALLDETMGWAFFHRGIWGVTGRITVTFKQPVPTGEELVVSGWVARERSRTIETKGELARASDGAVLAEGNAVFFRMPADRQAELEKRYGGAPGEAFVKIREALEREETARTDTPDADGRRRTDAIRNDERSKAGIS